MVSGTIARCHSSQLNIYYLLEKIKYFSFFQIQAQLPALFTGDGDFLFCIIFQGDHKASNLTTDEVVHWFSY